MSGERKEERIPDAEGPDAERKVGRGKDDGTGAFAGTQHGGSNDGVTSAKPQVITGQEDASFKTGRSED